jgi:hypothetical protein
VSGETWLLIVAVIGTASLIYCGVKTARDKKLLDSRKDRRLTAKRCRLLGVDAQLHDGHISRRIDVSEH